MFYQQTNTVAPPYSGGARHLAASLNTRRIGNIYHVELTKGTDGFGIRIAERDNALGTRRPIYIITITTAGPAYRDGRLKEGDMLLEINETDLTDKTLPDVTKMLKEVKVGEAVNFVVSRQESHEESEQPITETGTTNGCDNERSLINFESPNGFTHENEDALSHRKSVIVDGPGIYVYDIPINDTKSAGLGLYLKYPKMDTKDLGVFIEKVITGGAAWKDGRLQPDDQILAINGMNLTGLSHSHAADILKSAVHKGTSSIIRLNIQRRMPPKDLLTETSDEQELTRSQSARAWDEESIDLRSGEERFQRDGFGRQSISEKKHARLNAKNTETYKRNQKAPPKNQTTDDDQCHAECHKKIEKLEKLTASLMSHIEDLKLQINHLVSNVPTNTIAPVEQQYNMSTLRKVPTLPGSSSRMSQIAHRSNWSSSSEPLYSQYRTKNSTYSEDERVIRMAFHNRLIAMRVPNWVERDYDINKILPAPSVNLKLDWVHGYRGRDCRSNLYFLPTGECIYFVASVVVLYNPIERRQRHYLEHTESVECLAVHPNKLIVASAQSAILNRREKRPIVRVWNTVNLNTLKIIEFNEDLEGSICCLAFSKHDQGATLAVVDESNEHTITLLDWNKEKNWRIGHASSGHEPLLAIEFHPIDKYTLVTVGKLTVNFWDIRGMTLLKKSGLFDNYDKPKFVLCLTFNDQGDTITGDSNGNVIIWPRGSYRPGRVISNCHHGGVFSVVAMKDGSYLTGGRDRRIVEWDENFTRTGREALLPEHYGGVRHITHARGSQVLVGTLRNSLLLGSLDEDFQLIMQSHTESISALAIHPIYAQYLTGGFDEQIHLFDSASHSVIWSKCLTMPASAACFSPNSQILVVGSTQGRWLVIDTSSLEILFTRCDGTGTINCVKFSPNGDFFAIGSYDTNTYIYQMTGVGFCRVGACVGHTTPIKELDWSEDGRYIQTQSMNFELMFWVAHNCRPLEDENIIDDLKWFTHNCTIGFSVIGIWSDSTDSALINHCDKSNSNDLMVSVTDTGTINIFKWPPYYGQCLSQKYFGNVEKFNLVKFLANDSKLIAIGAKNCVTTEWTIDRGCNLEV